MKISIQFQYLPPGSARPIDASDSDKRIENHDENHPGEYLPIPDVGDTVSYVSNDVPVTRKVLTRHFGYTSGDIFDYDGMYVNIVVGDVSKEEMTKRLKE
jgi:hypothetical protein